MTDKKVIITATECSDRTQSLLDTPNPIVCARCHLPIQVPGEYFISVYDSMAQTTMYYHWSCYMHP